MKEVKRILMSGGSGLLGTALRHISEDIIAPSHIEMDVCDLGSISQAIEKYKPDIFLHAAAFTSPPKCDEEPMEALKNNIIGTSNAVLAAAKNDVRLVYISTDYVFKGDKGNYREEDELLPQNRYAWSKLGGECAVRMYDNSLIIRTSFYPDEFPYPAAFVDQYTSRDGVSVIAKMIYDLINKDVKESVIHVGTKRKTVKELAVKLGANVREASYKDIGFNFPADTSFSLERLNKYIKK